MISRIFAIAKQEAREGLYYRFDLLLYIFNFIVQIAVYIFIWIIFQNTDTIAGWNFNELLLLYGVMMLSVAVTDLLFDSTYGIGKRLIKNGKFDTILLRPVHPLISILGESQTSTALGYIVIAIVLIVVTLMNLNVAITAFFVLKILYFGILGGIIIGGIQTIFSITGFWTYKSNEVVWSVFQLHKLAEYPIEIYNRFIRVIITIIIPFACVAYYPTLNYLNIGQSKMAYISPIVAIIIWFIAIKVWNWALNKYRSTGN